MSVESISGKTGHCLYCDCQNCSDYRKHALLFQKIPSLMLHDVSDLPWELIAGVTEDKKKK